MFLEGFKDVPLMGILRGVDECALLPLSEVVVSSGIKVVEITMNTPGAGFLIQKLKKFAKNRFSVGAGTVLNMEQLFAALEAGADFIVMPVVQKDIISHCVKRRMPVFPGALTPNEIFSAWKLGATMVKVFPAKRFGPSYFNEVKAPLNDVRLLACGGITPENIAEYIRSGADAAAFGASIFKEEWIEKKQFALIEQAIKELVNAIPRRVG
ncbi:MAG: bifunctional 4-hydroxy-2-oxoglutarate aldolase/2-dehydro-3-deoxy-phosphogluconate aldolase [Candidatus Omnitrophota bacterium]